MVREEPLLDDARRLGAAIRRSNGSSNYLVISVASTALFVGDLRNRLKCFGHRQVLRHVFVRDQGRPCIALRNLSAEIECHEYEEVEQQYVRRGFTSLVEVELGVDGPVFRVYFVFVAPWQSRPNARSVVVSVV